MFLKKILIIYLVLLTGLAACIPVPRTAVPPTGSSAPLTTLSPLTPSPIAPPAVPDFTHIVVIFFENREFDSVIGNLAMPNYNQYASENTLLTQYYAVAHPSLPNYIAVFGGDTFKIKSDCTKCFVKAPSLADQIEASGRTWRAYLEGMPRPCFVGSTASYVQKHNPFIYFDPIRLDKARCEASIVPLTQLDSDLAAGKLPNFVYLMPNLCNSAHDASTGSHCGLDVADHWLAGSIQKLLAYLQPRAATEPYLIVITWDEGDTNHSCCGLPAKAGGRVPTVLISSLAKAGFQDATPYTHYSLLKTIETGWGLPLLGHAADPGNVIITAPWE